MARRRSRLLAGMAALLLLVTMAGPALATHYRYAARLTFMKGDAVVATRTATGAGSDDAEFRIVVLVRKAELGRFIRACGSDMVVVTIDALSDRGAASCAGKGGLAILIDVALDAPQLTDATIFLEVDSSDTIET